VGRLAAALSPRACSRVHPIAASKLAASLFAGSCDRGQQAGLSESGSKLPHSKAPRRKQD
jgi:hypothetical protein